MLEARTKINYLFRCSVPLLPLCGMPYSGIRIPP